MTRTTIAPSPVTLFALGPLSRKTTLFLQVTSERPDLCHELVDSGPQILDDRIIRRSGSNGRGGCCHFNNIVIDLNELFDGHRFVGRGQDELSIVG